MRRRNFIQGIVGSAVGWPVTARAQKPIRIQNIGVLLPGTTATHGGYLASFRQGLGELGYVEGSNFVLDLRWAEGRPDRLQALAADLVARKVDVIVTGSTQATVAAGQATASIPIVQAAGSDPTRIGGAGSLARPGGNLTGLTNGPEDLIGKQLDLLMLLVPTASRVGVLGDPLDPYTEWQLRNVQQAAKALRVIAELIAVPEPAALDDAFETPSRGSFGGLVVLRNPIFVAHSRHLVELAAKASIPVSYPFREFVLNGGLISYGVNIANNYRHAAKFVDRIFKGERPADLPIEQPTKFELAINLRTAKTLGLQVPDKLRFTADDVIE